MQLKLIGFSMTNFNTAAQGEDDTVLNQVMDEFEDDLRLDKTFRGLLLLNFFSCLNKRDVKILTFPQK